MYFSWIILDFYHVIVIVSSILHLYRVSYLFIQLTSYLHMYPSSPLPSVLGKFVLKPQREGGGNNVWGESMVKLLQTLTPEERSAYILMGKIEAESRHQVYYRAGKVATADCLCELGVYATYLSDNLVITPTSVTSSSPSTQGDDSTSNSNIHSRRPPVIAECIGYLLRTKPSHTDEGGVAAGFAVLDSPLLYDM